MDDRDLRRYFNALLAQQDVDPVVAGERFLATLPPEERERILDQHRRRIPTPAAVTHKIVGAVDGPIHLACSEELLRVCAIPYRMHAASPKAGFQISFPKNDAIYEAVRHGEVDFGLAICPKESSDLIAELGWKEKIIVVVPPFHALAQSAVLLPSDLAKHDFIGFDSDLVIRHTIDQYFRKQDVNLKVTLQFDNIQVIKEAVLAGLGVSALPERTVQAEVDSGHLVAIPLGGEYLPISVVRHVQKQLSVAAKAFIARLGASSALPDSNRKLEKSSSEVAPR